MLNWFRKILVVLIIVFIFGLVMFFFILFDNVKVVDKFMSIVG